MGGRRWGSCGCAVLIAAGAPATVLAQTQLPEIVVTSPSPIVRAPARRPAAPAAPVAAGPTVPESVEALLLPPPFPIVTDAFVPVTVLTQADIERAPGAGQIGDVLFTRPGLSGSTFAPGANRPVIRGLDNYRVRIQENGIGVHDVSDLSEDHGVPVDPLAAEQIEVIRGPATLRFGSQAIGGVVSVTNNRIPDKLPADTFSARFKGAMTSVDRGLEGAAALDARAGNLAVHADGFARSGDDYRIPGGRQANTAYRADGQSVGASYFFDGGFVGAAVTRYASLYRIPGIEAAERNVRIDLDQTRFTSKGEFRPEASPVEVVRFWLGATRYRHHEIAVEDGADGIQATFRNREEEGRVEAQFVPVSLAIGVLTGAVGAQFAHQKLVTSGEAGSLLAPTDTRSFAAYLFEELRISDTLKLQAAGRIETVRVTGTAATFPADFLPDGIEPPEMGVSRSFTPVSASVGVLQELAYGVVASLTGQYVERAPKGPELFSKGPHEATSTFEIGDPTLKKEAARTVEVGLRRGKGAFRFDATAFYTRYAGFIFKRLTGIGCGDEFDTCGVEDELTQIVYGQRDATFKGVELMGQLDVLPIAGGMFGVDGQYDFVRARFADGTNVPRIPPHRLGGGLFWRDPHWFARVSLLHAFAQRRIAANETETPGYSLLRAELSHTRKLTPSALGPREFTLGIVGDNLLDDDVRNHVSFKKDEVLLPGRNIRLFASVRF